MKLKQVLKKMIFSLFGSFGFSKTLVNLEKSRTYGTFCEKVYGRNLLQLNMTDENQLQKLFSVLNLDESKTVLDLGCGTGVFSEYVSDLTGANVTGVDFAKGAITSAQKRTVEKSNKVNFLVENINSLSPALGEYDCIIAIDTLYFVKDLDRVIKQLQKHLKPSGKLAIFYTSRRSSGISSPEISDNNLLPKALSNAGFKVETVNFTASERKIWELTLSVADDLKDGFKKEKNLSIYKSRKAEAKRNLDWINKGIFDRNLYVAIK